MLDINLFRLEKGGNPSMIKESQRRRGASEQVVDEVIELDKEWITLRFKVDECNKEAKIVQGKIGKIIKEKLDKALCVPLVEEREGILKKKQVIIEEMEAKENERNNKISSIGNLVHSSTPSGADESFNPVIRKWSPSGVCDDGVCGGSVDGNGSVSVDGNGNDGIDTSIVPPAMLNRTAGIPNNKGLLPHHQVLSKLNGYDPERGAKVAGHRGYFLKDVGVRLNQALINYGMDFMRQRQYTLLQTPFMLLKDVMGKCAQLDDFDDQLYRITSSEEDRYLIATSEQPIAAMHSNEWFEQPDKQLPLRYCGYSTCFRKEAGSSGKDTWGIFRVHQFEKIEQFVITDPEDSWKAFDEMIGHSEAFYQSLGLSYRLVEIVAGALNNAASKKYDLEAWFPNYGEWKELVSCSNCTDYQSRRLEIRCGLKKMGDREKKYVHCLNSTLCATERTLCCILENYQCEDGLRIPKPLVPYMGGETFIAFQ